MSLFGKSYISILKCLTLKSRIGCIRKAAFGNRIYSSFAFKLREGNFIYTISINAIVYIFFADRSRFWIKKYIYDFENCMIVYSRAKFER